jgi:hypothetical protein
MSPAPSGEGGGILRKVLLQSHACTVYCTILIGYWDFPSLEGHGFGGSLVKIKDEHFSIFFWAILAGLPPETESCYTVYKIPTCALSTLSYVS